MISFQCHRVVVIILLSVTLIALVAFTISCSDTSSSTTAKTSTSPNSSYLTTSMASTSITPTIPADHKAAYINQDCTICHKPGGIKPNPADHANYSISECQKCHAPPA
jgi:hypothetical protein